MCFFQGISSCKSHPLLVARLERKKKKTIKKVFMFKVGILKKKMFFKK